MPETTKEPKTARHQLGIYVDAETFETLTEAAKPHGLTPALMARVLMMHGLRALQSGEKILSSESGE